MPHNTSSIHQSELYNDDESEYKYNILFPITEATGTGYSLDVLMGRYTFATVTGHATQQIIEMDRRFFDGKKFFMTTSLPGFLTPDCRERALPYCRLSTALWNRI